jgi:Helicase HerA, central domain
MLEIAPMTVPGKPVNPTHGSLDPRAVAFCAVDAIEVFHAVAYRNDIWKEDRFDVETIHDEARSVFQRLVTRASAFPGASAGRILLLQGEAGSGKTHLMRAFRNWTHAGGRGYYGYMQMTSVTNDYARYVLTNLIDSLDQPYFESAGETTGLMRLSTAIAESPKGLGSDRLEQIRSDEIDTACLARMIDALADQIVLDDLFNNIDIDLVRMLLYLQRDDPRLKGRVVKYLRCEDLSPADRGLLGEIPSRVYDDAPIWLIQRLAELMAALEAAPLILCVDQLEDIFNLDDATGRFRRVLATLCDLASRIPTAVVVISCLENYYDSLRNQITKSLRDRVENDPKPLLLKGARDAAEIRQIVSQRLRVLYDAAEVPFQEDDPTYPFPDAFLNALAGLPTREVLTRCQEYRERCVAEGRVIAELGSETGAFPSGPKPNLVSDTTPWEQSWNDHRNAFRGPLPEDEPESAALLAGTIKACSDEFENVRWFGAQPDGRFIEVDGHDSDDAVDRRVIGVCERSAKGGRLGGQITEVSNRAGELTAVVVRSTPFPTDPKTAIVKQLGEFVKAGGRRVVVEDSDWRVMAAYQPFRARHQNAPGFMSWLKQGQPLSRLRSVRLILDLDNVKPSRTTPNPEPAQPADKPSPPPPMIDRGEPLFVGVTDDRAAQPCTLDPAELTRHAAFLGGSGSGKTTIALGLVEQLLLRGVPAILIDRKGDLCGYARADAGTQPSAGTDLAARLERLRAEVDVALYTPGNPQGRPLSISIAPTGLGQLGSFERDHLARYAASALAGMMNYSVKGSEQSRQAILARAIELFSQCDNSGSISLEGLIEYINEKDAGLVNAIGYLDTKLFDKLVQDLETLRLSKGEFLSSRGEPLDIEALLGLGRHARPGKTRLSIISTKFLGVTQDVQFWVSQFLVELGRWVSRSPTSGRLQAVLLCDEADLYLPAQRQPPTKAPMEDLLKRARAAGLGLFLATQSPGDFDYKCRDNIRAWFVGRVKEKTALDKMKPMLSECRVDVASKLAVQEPGQFHLIRDGAITSVRTGLSALSPAQLSPDEILRLARHSRGVQES